MKKILIVTGDPNSINSEIINKIWKKLNTNLKKRIFLISSFELLKKQFQYLNYRTKIIKVNNLDSNIKSDKIKVLDINIKFKKSFSVSTDQASKFVIKSLNEAHKLALRGDVKGIINCAIDKTLLKKKSIGVTEFLSSKCKIKNFSEVMLIRNENFSISPITTHINIKDVSKNLSQKKIINKVKTINSWFKSNMKKKPYFGLLGLNPHNSELKKNSEEIRIIIPAIKKLKNLGVKIRGPLVADTIFIKDYKNFDIIIGMYHDQVLTPFKTIFKFDAINVTLGLKYLRVSPDHGTAKDIIGKNKAKALSLLKCVIFLNKFGK